MSEYGQYSGSEGFDNDHVGERFNFILDMKPPVEYLSTEEIKNKSYEEEEEEEEED